MASIEYQAEGSPRGKETERVKEVTIQNYSFDNELSEHLLGTEHSSGAGDEAGSRALAQMELLLSWGEASK